jgi:platelet-activating factor acetylhydrolase
VTQPHSCQIWQPSFTMAPLLAGSVTRSWLEGSPNTPHTGKRPDDVPKGTKPPNSREPAGFREKLLRTPLPYYSGPYSVGMMDIEVPAREPRTFSEIKRNHMHLLELETVLFSVYYPSDFGSGHGTSPEGEKKWGRATWLPRPRVEVAKGYGKFAGIPALPTIGWFGSFSSILD